jgi:hypothetical protein
MTTCKLEGCKNKISKGTYCSRSCASRGKDFSKRKPTGLALLTPEERAKFYKERSKSEAYKATRSNSFDLINERKASDEKYREKLIAINTAGKLASPDYKEAAAATLASLRGNPKIEKRRRKAIRKAVQS